MVRDAGTIAFEGRLDPAGGGGKFTHTPGAEYLAVLQKMGYSPSEPDELFSLTVQDVSRAFIGDLQDLGYRDVSAEDLVSMRIHGVTIDYVRKIKARLKNVPFDELVSMRIHGRG